MPQNIREEFKVVKSIVLLFIHANTAEKSKK